MIAAQGTSAITEQTRERMLARRRRADLSARAVAALALSVLAFCGCYLASEPLSEVASRELRILPRVMVFVFAGLLTLLLGSLKFSPRALLLGGAVCVGGMLSLLSLAPVLAYSGEGASAGIWFASSDPPLQLLRFLASAWGAILLGIWLGSDITKPAHFVALLLCAAVGDLWLNMFAVPESVHITHPLRLLRMPLPPQIGKLPAAPAFTDLLFFSAAITAARQLKFPIFSVFFGALSGYTAASFLGLGPWPAWPGLSMLLFTSGVLIACWPDLNCTPKETAKAILVSTILLAALAGMSALHHRTHPPPSQPPDQTRNLNTA